MITVGSIVKLPTKDTGTIYYRVDSIQDGSFVIIPLCRIRKGYLTIKYKNSQGTHIYKSQIGVHYLFATRKELAQIKKILDQSVGYVAKQQEAV